jgi:hypothetical protein
VSHKSIVDSRDISIAKYELERFIIGDPFDLYEDGLLIASIEPSNCTAEVSFGKLILSCWGDDWSRSWRIIDCIPSADLLHLLCTRKMGLVHCVVQLRRTKHFASIPGLSRREFALKLTALIKSKLAGFRIEHSVLARDDRRNLSGLHVRMILKHYNKTIAAIGVSDCELQANVDAVLGSGIIWLDELRKRRPVNRLILFVPRNRTDTIATRLTAVTIPAASVSLFAVDQVVENLEPISAFDQGDLADAMRRVAKKALWPRDHTIAPEVFTVTDSIVQLAPDIIETSRRGSWIVASIRGLEFARISIRTLRVEFGVGEERKKLSDRNYSELQNLVRSIADVRTADSDGLNDILFRSHGERWLESEIKHDITAIDATLDPRYVYAQVPAYRGENRAFIDVLTTTRNGRLVIVELKISESSEFPFQALDYWLRVEWHRQRGDFQRRGYFAGLKIADAQPLLYLVAPLFRFHASTKLIAGVIASDVPVLRIGINEDWRRGVRVLLRERLNR